MARPWILLTLALALSLVGSGTHAAPPTAAPAPGPITVLRCGALFDARAARIGPAATLVIEGGKIARVAAADAAAPAGSQVIDLVAHTCLPGMMDMHVHLAAQYSERSKLERFTLNATDYAVRAVANARKTLMAGFTTVRDLGGRGGSVLAVRDAVKAGVVPGPRIFAAGKSIATTGGHADPTNGVRHDWMGDPGPDRGVINGPDEARKAVRQRYKSGSDQIKITATGGVLSVAKSGDNAQFTDAELRAIVETARDYGMHVAAHAHGVAGMQRAVRAGVHSIEHGTLMDAPTMALMRRYKTWLVPTISAGEWVAQKAKIDGFFPDQVRPKAASIGPRILGTFSKAYKAGVRIAFGTDVGVPPHGENARELALMVQGGMPPLIALQSATWNTAKLLSKTKALGTLEAAKHADVIAVEGNPAEDITRMQRVAFVMKAGRIHKRP